MPKTRRKAGYSLRDGPLFRLRSRRKLAALLHTTPAALTEISKHPHPYKRRWKHKQIKDGEAGFLAQTGTNGRVGGKVSSHRHP